MKTRILIASVALIVLAASAAFGQRSTMKQHLSPGMSNQGEMVNANYTMEYSRLETLWNEIRSWVDNKLSRHSAAAPVVYMTFLAEDADVLYAGEMEVESWMTVPFEYSLEEGLVENLEVESWNDILEVESWNDILEVESWMSVPFEYSLEVNTEVESWMTVPFEHLLGYPFEEELVVEEWMVTAWF